MFGGGSSTPTPSTSVSHDPSAVAAAAGSVPPPYTPTNAAPSVITSGLVALKPSQDPGLSNIFQSFTTGKGSLGRSPLLSGRSLMGGAQ